MNHDEQVQIETRFYNLINYIFIVNSSLWQITNNFANLPVFMLGSFRGIFVYKLFLHETQSFFSSSFFVWGSSLLRETLKKTGCGQKRKTAPSTVLMI